MCESKLLAGMLVRTGELEARVFGQCCRFRFLPFDSLAGETK
jgi:hypothetical protein